MGRNCNLELRLLPPAASSHQTDYDDGCYPDVEPRQQQLTIFYNGRITVSDVTELQARAIILLASWEMEKKSKTPTGCSATSPLPCSQRQSPTTGLSMKRSLQRFLEKRKNRVQSHSPYHH